METRSLKYVADACGGELKQGEPDAKVRRVHSDSRTLAEGDLFVAITGDRFDGHAFLAEASGKGAVASVAARSRAAESGVAGGLILVDDTRMALGMLATRYREDFDLPVIAVAGSNGKTTTKDLIASVLAQRLPTLKSEASFNNDVGVPMTLTRLERKHQAAVVEVGTNHPGELAPLVRMARPKFGVITCIGREHLEFFGDVAGVADEEGGLAALLPGDGALFVHADSPEIDRVIRRARCRVVRIGEGQGGWRASNIRVGAEGTTFEVAAPKKTFEGEYRVQMPGRQHATNALFAIALGAELNLSADEVRRGLAACEPPRMRSKLERLNGVWVLDDAYNANADSMTAALRTLIELPCSRRRVAVLGDMAELGASSRAAHEEVGRMAAELHVDRLVTVGGEARFIAGAARAAGHSDVTECGTAEEAAAAVKSVLAEGDVVLVKASRATRLERVVAALKNQI